jgi:hypothetical protein
VPVLSEHMVVAFPIVSQADSTRMRLLSENILRDEYAKEIVTASGRPSEARQVRALKIRSSQPYAWLGVQLHIDA